jgi:hypothetical protein
MQLHDVLGLVVIGVCGLMSLGTLLGILITARHFWLERQARIKKEYFDKKYPPES